MKNLVLGSIMMILSLASCSVDKDKPDAYGSFEATEITVSSMATGKIMWLKIEEGEVIDSGVMVGVVDTLDPRLKISLAREQQLATSARKGDLEAQIAVQEQNKQNILVDKARIENLYRDGAATKKQMDDIAASLSLIDKQIASIRSQYASLDAQVRTFDRQVAQLEKTISDARIINPVKGTVLAKYAEANEITAYGKPLYKIADLSQMMLRVYVSGAQLPYIKPGQEVEVRFDRDEKTNNSVKGVVRWISQSAEFTPKTIQTKEERVNLVYAAKVRVKNDGSLKIGMPGEIKFMPAD